MSVSRKGPKCDCCGIRQDVRSSEKDCEGCDAGNTIEEILKKYRK